MSFRKFIKNTAISLFDGEKYQKKNTDVKENYALHYLKFGFNEGRPAHFFNEQNTQSELLPYIEIQHLKSKEVPHVSMVLENFNETPSPCSYIRLVFPLQYLDFLNEINLNEDVVNKKLWALNRIPTFSTQFNEWVLSLNPDDRIIYDIDDDLISHYGENSDEVKKIISCILLAEVVTVSTIFLYDKLKKFNIKLKVRSNFCLTDLSTQESDFNDELSILYMGTSTHNEDFKLIFNDLVKLSKKYPKLRVDLVGLDEHSESKFINGIKITTSYYPQFIKKFNKIETYKIGIIPLIDNDINRSKSNIKYYDYINKCQYILCSDIGEYSESRFPRLYKVPREGSWINAIEKLLAMPKIKQEEINRSYSIVRNIKFSELNNLSSIINSVYFNRGKKEIDYINFMNYLSESEIYNLFFNKYSIENKFYIKKDSSEDDIIKWIHSDEKMGSIVIEDLLSIKLRLKIISENSLKTNKKISFIVKVDYSKAVNNSPLKFYDENLEYLSDHNSFKLHTLVKFPGWNAIFISL